jgi:hypothetical protein
VQKIDNVFPSKLRQVKPPYLSRVRRHPADVPAAKHQLWKGSQPHLRPLSRRSAHPHQPPRPHESAVLGDDAPQPDEGGDASSGIRVSTGSVGGGRHRVSRGWKAVLLACQRLWLATRGLCFLHRPHCCIQEEVVCSSRISRKLSQRFPSQSTFLFRLNYQLFFVRAIGYLLPCAAITPGSQARLARNTPPRLS